MKYFCTRSVALLAATCLFHASLPGQQISQLSKNSFEQAAASFCSSPSISANGRWISFTSDAHNLDSTDTNQSRDVFVRDRLNGLTRRVSVGLAGKQGNGHSFASQISSGGRYVVFVSEASNLVMSDNNECADVFLHDLETGITERISRSTDGQEGNAPSTQPCVSPNGRFIAFTSSASNFDEQDQNSATDVFLHDRWLNGTVCISVNSVGVPANAASCEPAIAANGGMVVFTSEASDLPGGGRNQIYLRSFKTRSTTLLSQAPDGQPANGSCTQPKISIDGQVIAFTSRASNLVAGDTNQSSDVFTFTSNTKSIQRISVQGLQQEISSASHSPSISEDGRWICFASMADDLDATDQNGLQDVYLRDRFTLLTVRISKGTSKFGDSGMSFTSAISADGTHVAFSSSSTDLVPDDQNQSRDIFLWREVPQLPLVASIPPVLIPALPPRGNLPQPRPPVNRGLRLPNGLLLTPQVVHYLNSTYPRSPIGPVLQAKSLPIPMPRPNQ